MKIAERIKAAIALNPQIIANRAKLRAMYYLQKNNPKTMRISIFGGYGYTEISLLQKCKEFGSWHEREIASVNMQPLSNTPHTEGLKQLAEKGISGIGGVALDCVKKVLDNLDQSAKV